MPRHAGMPKKKTAASRVGRSSAPKEDPLLILVVATRLPKYTGISVSSMTRELHGQWGAVQGPSEGNCLVRQLGRGRAVPLARQNLVVETEAADYRDTLLELWPHSIEFGLERAEREWRWRGEETWRLAAGGRGVELFFPGTRPSRMDHTALCLNLICMCRF